jgi:predicted glycoside hydrolase/deacetylase ChbG (UPF0249 family)
MIHYLVLVLVLVVALAPALQAQTRTLAERLGYPRDAKLLILHADDLGVAHSVNAASLAALDSGFINSASAMVPTPWFKEVADYANTHPNHDLGLHLTLNSEWQTYRWGSVESTNRVASLVDSTGTFASLVEPFARRAKLKEVERELRAQISRAKAMGLEPTHLDSHMGALFATPELFALYAKLAREHRLPFLALRAPALQHLLRDDDIVLDALVIADPSVTADQWKEFYLKAIADLKPGLTEIIVHLGFDDAELQAVTVNHPDYGSAWRQRDFDVVRSPEFRKALGDNKVILVTWRQLAAAPR